MTINSACPTSVRLADKDKVCACASTKKKIRADLLGQVASFSALSFLEWRSAGVQPMAWTSCFASFRSCMLVVDPVGSYVFSSLASGARSSPMRFANEHLRRFVAKADGHPVRLHLTAGFGLKAHDRIWIGLGPQTVHGCFARISPAS